MITSTERKIKTILEEIQVMPEQTFQKSMDEVISIVLNENKPLEHIVEMSTFSERKSENEIFDMAELMQWRNNNNNIYEVHSNLEIRSHRKWIGNLIIFGKKIIRKFLKWYIEPIVEQQNKINGSFTASINALCNNEIVTQEQFCEIGTKLKDVDNTFKNIEYDKRLQEVEQKSSTEIELLKSFYEKQLVELEKKYEEGIKLEQDSRMMEITKLRQSTKEYIEQQEKSLSKQLSEINLTFDGMENNLCELWDTIDSHWKTVCKIKEESDMQLDYLQFKYHQLLQGEKITISSSAVAEQINDKMIEKKMDYFRFENYFRGNQQRIKAAQKAYLSYFIGKTNVLDLGCGRGEFLELLQENHIESKGVDLYQDFVEYCNYKGLKAVCADVIDFLCQLPNESLGGIFSAQLVEHLQEKQIISLCNLAYQKIKKDSYIVIETPNPSSLSIYMNSFYMDPSHIKPIHPKTMEYFLKEAGFKEIELIYVEQSKVQYKFPLLKGTQIENLSEFNDGINFLSEIIFGCQDYAIVAKK